MLLMPGRISRPNNRKCCVIWLLRIPCWPDDSVGILDLKAVTATIASRAVQDRPKDRPLVVALWAAIVLSSPAVMAQESVESPPDAPPATAGCTAHDEILADPPSRRDTAIL